MTSELRSCPFCGSKVIIRNHKTDYDYAKRCLNNSCDWIGLVPYEEVNDIVRKITPQQEGKSDE